MDSGRKDEKLGHEENKLFDLIKNCDHDSLREMLSNGHDVNTSDNDNYSLLHMAVDYGDEVATKILLETRGCKVNNQTSFHKLSPLHFAAQDGRKSLVKLLLDNGAYVDITNHTNCTPVYFAVCGNHIETVKLLLERRANINISDSNKISPLLQAVNISVEMTKLLLDHGAEMSSYCRELHTALLGNKLDIANVLLDKLSVGELTPNRIGRSPLQNAAAHITGNPNEVVKLIQRLIMLGQDINYMNSYGSILHILIGRNSYLKNGCIDLIAKKCFDYVISLPDCDLDKYLFIKNTGTPLTFALSVNQYYYAEKLLIEGANVKLCHLNDFRYTRYADKVLKLLYYCGYYFDDDFQRKNRPRNDDDLDSFKTICQWIYDKQSELMNLKCLIRASLRQFYGKCIKHIINNINYPDTLCSFILFENTDQIN